MKINRNVFKIILVQNVFSLGQKLSQNVYLFAEQVCGGTVVGGRLWGMWGTVVGG